MRAPDGVLTVIGDLVEDVVVWTDTAPRHGTDNPAVITRRRGGSGANVAVAAAAAGARARFLGRVGTDATAALLEADLRAAGVDARLQRHGRTGCVVVLVGPDGERTMYPDRGAAAELGAIDADDLAGTALLHVPLYGFLETSCASHLERAAAHVRSADGATTIDLSASSAIDRLGAAAVRRLIRALAPAVVFANADEARAADLSSLEPPGGSCFVVKDGPRPVTIVHAGGHCESISPPRIDVVRDTTGAGDTFAGTFLARVLAGDLPAAACASAHAAAAATLGLAGAGTTPIGAPP